MTTLTTNSGLQQYQNEQLRLDGHLHGDQLPYESLSQYQHSGGAYHLGSQTPQADTARSGSATPNSNMPSSAELLSLYGPKPIRAQFACDYCRVRKAKCSGTEPCDRCVSKKRLCTFSSVQNQRKVTRSLKDLRAQRNNGSPSRSPVLNGIKPASDVSSHAYYIRGSGILGRESPGFTSSSPIFQEEGVASSVGPNGRPALIPPGPVVGLTWPHDWTGEQTASSGFAGGYRRGNPPPPVNAPAHSHFLYPVDPQQQPYVSSPVPVLIHSPLSTGGHYYSAQSSPTFFHGAESVATQAMHGIGSAATAPIGLGIEYSNANLYAAVGHVESIGSSLSAYQQHHNHTHTHTPIPIECHKTQQGLTRTDSAYHGWRHGQQTLAPLPSERQDSGQSLDCRSDAMQLHSQQQQTSPSFNLFAPCRDEAEGLDTCSSHSVQQTRQTFMEQAAGSAGSDYSTNSALDAQPPSHPADAPSGDHHSSETPGEAISVKQEASSLRSVRLPLRGNLAHSRHGDPPGIGEVLM